MYITGDYKKSLPKAITIKKCNNILLIFHSYYNTLSKEKNKINENNYMWDKMKKITNPYELIHISTSNKEYNIAKYIPLSRSYFKLWELIHDYHIFQNINDDIVTVCLAEGPGGFMEAIYNYRKNFKDKIYGITLPSTNKYIPGWKKLFDHDEFKFNITYGNLYNLDDILNFINKFNTQEKAFLVTADGGFDYSSDFNNQEIMSYRIIFSEIVTALAIQKIGGVFICKIFDIFTTVTIKYIYILYCLYDKVYITKPKTSRMANSEKYIVALGFKGIDECLLKSMYKIIDEWDEDENKYDIPEISLENNYIHFFYKYNQQFIENQLNYIKITLELVNNKPDKNKYQDMIKKQISYAHNWCKTYNIEINKDNKYI